MDEVSGAWNLLGPLRFRCFQDSCGLLVLLNHHRRLGQGSRQVCWRNGECIEFIQAIDMFNIICRRQLELTLRQYTCKKPTLMHSKTRIAGEKKKEISLAKQAHANHDVTDVGGRSFISDIFKGKYLLMWWFGMIVCVFHYWYWTSGCQCKRNKSRKYDGKSTNGHLMSSCTSTGFLHMPLCYDPAATVFPTKHGTATAICTRT